jgi:ribokinase
VGERSIDLLVVGDLMVDVVVHHDGPVAVGSDTPASVRFHGGGSAANTAAWAGSLGCRTRLLAAVGDDAAGRDARDELARLGVELVGPVVADAVTGTCVVLVGADRERTMFPDRGANSALGPEAVATAFDRVADDADDERGPGPAAVHVSGYALLGEGSREAGRATLAAARAAGLPVSVDAASAAPLRTVGSARFLAWVDGIDLLFANDDEVAALGGEAAVLGAVGALVVKHGAAGATWTDGIERTTVPAVAVDAIDSTGAGDAFAAGYLDARHRGLDVAACLARGAEVAARAVTGVGARP